LRVGNLIYRQVFDLNWVEEHLPRPERRTVVMAMGTITVLALALVVLSVTGILNRLIYRPLEREEDWIKVPAGVFAMGADVQQGYQICMKNFGEASCSTSLYKSEEPVHFVYLDSYQIMRYEVTNEQYAQCVRNGACEGGGYEYQSTAWNILNRLNDRAYANHPVVSVNWFQAEKYCKWIGARLPTEAEWEKAARGTDGRTYPWGENIDCAYANYFSGKNDKCVGDTTPVGSYEIGQSPYGVFDMAGNVWEWVADWYSEVFYSSSPAKNPVGPDLGSGRVLRGGSWYNSDVNARTAVRSGLDPAGTSHYFGFRCARSH
jgi:formylglycine-generating enzyme required for sulfatase activity